MKIKQLFLVIQVKILEYLPFKQRSVSISQIGRDELKSDSGLIDCQRLCRLIVERCTTAREAIKMAGELTAKYGWKV